MLYPQSTRLQTTRGRSAARNYKVKKIFGEFEWVITASSTKSMYAGGFFTFAGFDIAAKYTEASNV